jgi:DNA polymerase III epsilon subunit-like protein
MAQGITGRVIAQTPISVIDFETTGLTPGPDRVVEVSVVRMEPGRAPEVTFDTLVDPRRPMGATFVHGITDEDVAGAPVFGEVAGDLVRALAGSVVTAYNAYFDMRFLEFELSASGLDRLPPYFCLMYLRPMLDIGQRCSLGRALARHGIANPHAHTAAGDSLASALLMQVCLDTMADLGIETYEHLAGRRSYKFVRSFHRDPLATAHAAHLAPCARVKSRR